MRRSWLRRESSALLFLPAVVLSLGLTVFNVLWLLRFGPRLSARYLGGMPAPLLALGSATLGVLSILWSILFPSGFLPGGVALFSLGWISLKSDARSRLLPNALTALMTWEVLATLAIATALHAVEWQTWFHGTTGAIVWGTSIGAGWLLKQTGMGDVKLAPALGFILGTLSVTAALSGLALAFIAAGVQGIVARAKGDRSGRIAFGPSMIGASMVVWVIVSLGTLTP